MKLQYRHILHNQWPKVKVYLNVHIEAEVIKPSFSSNSVPLVLVKNKLRAIRVFCDIIDLNTRTIRNI